MKKLLFAIVLLASAAIVTPKMASAQEYQPTGSYYDSINVYPVFFGKWDTVSTTDTFKVGIPWNPISITYSNDFLKVAGTPTVSVALYASSNNGYTYFTTPITTYTAVLTSTVTPVTIPYIISPNFGRNPYTNYMWVATPSASSTISWHGAVTPRQ